MNGKERSGTCGLVRRWNLTSQRRVDEVENSHLEIKAEQVRARLCRKECGVLPRDIPGVQESSKSEFPTPNRLSSWRLILLCS